MLSHKGSCNKCYLGAQLWMEPPQKVPRPNTLGAWSPRVFGLGTPLGAPTTTIPPLLLHTSCHYVCDSCVIWTTHSGCAINLDGIHVTDVSSIPRTLNTSTI